MKRHFKWDRTYINWGMTAFCVVALSLLFYFAVRNISVFGDFFRKLVTILAPFIWGLVICYLLSPLMRFLEERVFLPLGKRLYRKNKKGGAGKFARVMSILFSEIVLLLLIAALVYLIIPQILSSVQMLVQNSGTYADNVSKWLDGLLKNYPELDSYVGGLFGNINANVGNWLETRLLPQLGSLITSVSSGVYGFARSIYNLIIGIIVSVYLLADKEGFLAAVKRLSYAVFSVETADKLRQGLNFVDKTFMGFLSGKILDSLIIGIICYIVCSILKMPYTLLVSVIIGVTNIIPHHRPAHSGQLHRHQRLLGHVRHHSGQRPLRLLGYAAGRPRIRGDLHRDSEPDHKKAEKKRPSVEDRRLQGDGLYRSGHAAGCEKGQRPEGRDCQGEGAPQEPAGAPQRLRLTGAPETGRHPGDRSTARRCRCHP